MNNIFIISIIASVSLLNFVEIGSTQNNICRKCHPHDYDDGRSVDSLTEKENDRAFHPEIIENPGFTMEEYFENLTTYSPENSHGSCSYVSLIQYLSYYDTFLNDNIIPEQFDQSNIFASSLADAKSDSPGVVRRTYPDGGNNLYNYVIDNKDDDFQAYLMYVVNSALGRWPIFYSDSMSYGDYHYVFNDLFSNGLIDSTTVYYSSFDSSFTSQLAQTSLINLAKGIIDTGNPVIIQLVDENFSVNHSVVGYYYDSIGIYTNYGWNNTGSTRMPVPNLIHTHIYSITYSNITSLTHRHSNNYIVSTLNYCGCGQHVHAKNFSMINSNTHYRTCGCGYSAVESHIYENIGGVMKCECGHVM